MNLKVAKSGVSGLYGDGRNFEMAREMANKKRLIDANALKWKIGQVCLYVASLRCGKTIISKILESYRKAVFEEIDNAPTIDAVEVVHGRWIAVPSSDMNIGHAFKCSECNKMRFGSRIPNYCPSCGAKMDGDGNG